MTKHLSTSEAGISEAARILTEGGLVAMPTETVYGLAADACNGQAVARIYAAKGRPGFNPLIVHVSDLRMARACVHWPDMAEALSAAFWPGPLTLVLPQAAGSGLSGLVTAGLDTVAIRMPAHRVARRLLQAFGGPVAAPSANPSGQLSPTSAAHVRDGLDGRIDAILDGGTCPVGVESTIIGLTGDGPQLLRPGGIAGEEIERVLGQSLLPPPQSDRPTAPGQLTSHYAPGAHVRLEARDKAAGELLLGFGDVACDLNLSASGDLIEAAANLFEMLHRLDAQSPTGIAVSPIPHTGLGAAINDRLHRAAAPRPGSSA